MPQNFEDLKGKVVKHANGNLYIVIDLIFNQLNLSEKLILFRDFYDESLGFTLPESVFLSEINSYQYTNTNQKYLFESTGEDFRNVSYKLIKNTKQTLERNSINLKEKVMRFFKGQLYLVIDVIFNYETHEEMVLYRNFINENNFCALSKSTFLDIVNTIKVPNSTQKYIFETVDNNTLIHMYPNNSNLLEFKGQVFRRFKGEYIEVITTLYNYNTNEEFVLLKSFFSNYNVKVLPKTYFLGTLNSQSSHKYKTSYVFDLIESDKLPKKIPFKQWFFMERSVKSQYNIYWGIMLSVLYFFAIIYLISLM